MNRSVKAAVTYVHSFSTIHSNLGRLRRDAQLTRGPIPPQHKGVPRSSGTYVLCSGKRKSASGSKAAGFPRKTGPREWIRGWDFDWRLVRRRNRGPLCAFPRQIELIAAGALEEVAEGVGPTRSQAHLPR